MLNLRKQYRELASELDAAVREVLESGYFIGGPNVRAFEEQAQAYLDVEHAVGCNSGTDALHLALRAAGVGPGDEVITTAFTFVATVEAILYVGARPVFADIEPRSFNIDPDDIEAKITSATRAILPVHLFGLSANMTRVMALARAHRLTVVEDAAQAFGSMWGGRKVGGIGDFGCFSFYPTKTLGCYGDGGLVVTRSGQYASRLRSLCNHGQKDRYHHVEVGYNSRLDELQAAVLRVKLRYLDAHNARRREIAARFREGLEGTALELPAESADAHHVYGCFTVLTEGRDALMAGLADAGIASTIYYPIPLHRQDFCARTYADVSLPVTEQVAQRCLSLPIYPELEDAEIAEIVTRVRELV